MTKLNRACPASISVDRGNCHEFGSVERFFNFLIPINLIHTFMITDELHSVPINIAGRVFRIAKSQGEKRLSSGARLTGPSDLDCNLSGLKGPPL